MPDEKKDQGTTIPTIALALGIVRLLVEILRLVICDDR